MRFGRQPNLIFVFVFTFYLIVVFVVVLPLFWFSYLLLLLFSVCFSVCFCLSSIGAKEERKTKEGNSSPKNSTNEERMHPMQTTR